MRVGWLCGGDYFRSGGLEAGGEELSERDMVYTWVFFERARYIFHCYHILGVVVVDAAEVAKLADDGFRR